VLDSLILRFDLQSVYSTPDQEKTRKELEGNIVVEMGKEDASLEVSVFDTDPRRAADMANYLVTKLNDIYLDLSVTEAKANREFLERRYHQNLDDLKAAEDSMRAFQSKYGAYSVSDQVKAAVEAAAMLEAKIASKEIELSLLGKTGGVDNPQRHIVELEIAGLRRQQSIMRNGSPTKEERSLIFIPFHNAPEVGIEYFRRYREVELQGKLLELIVPLYEQARIEEQRNTPSVLLLDNAVPAIRASKPKRMILMIVVALGSLLGGLGLVILREGIARARRIDADGGERFDFIKRELHWRNLLK
jgi:tyrosine-protein kinase Etk/Wzc